MTAALPLHEDLEKAEQILVMTTKAMRDRATVQWTFHLEAGRKIDAQLLVECERALNHWLAGTVRALGGKWPRRLRYRLDMNSFERLPEEPDGHEYLRVTVDFAKMLGPKPELPA